MGLIKDVKQIKKIVTEMHEADSKIITEKS